MGSKGGDIRVGAYQKRRLLPFWYLGDDTDQVVYRVTWLPMPRGYQLRPMGMIEGSRTGHPCCRT